MKTMDLTPPRDKSAAVRTKVTAVRTKFAVCRTETFKKDYIEKWPALQPAWKGDTFCFCVLYECEFSVSRGGRDDCRRHIESKKHSNNDSRKKQVQKCQNISGFFPTAATSRNTNTTEAQVICAEVMLVDLVTELNLRFTALDKFTKAFKVMFKDMLCECSKKLWLVPDF